ncbi:alanine racemase [Lujinxingia sediminis]|uniref:Multifunctional fusion protein n=1 Tax=Lujinxingia sediminis TaxID=2480984 RepID=A0ABY0CV12_9DELT|nr:alanine racemase [Lujinxingia sediminis]
MHVLGGDLCASLPGGCSGGCGGLCPRIYQRGDREGAEARRGHLAGESDARSVAVSSKIRSVGSGELAARLTLGEVASWANGRLDGGDAEREISEVVVDSRRLLAAGALFVALEGPRFDGHAYVRQALESGAGAALVHHGRREEFGEGALIRVADTRAALQAIAAAWRAKFDIPVVAITGSNGKTIVKDMLASMLARGHTVHASPGSYNSQVGVPLTLLGIRPVHDVVLVEVGISQRGEMARQVAMVQPTHGILTNIGSAHAAGLGDGRGIAEEKMRLFEGLEAGRLVVLREVFEAFSDLFHVKPHLVDVGMEGDGQVDPALSGAFEENDEAGETALSELDGAGGLEGVAPGATRRAGETDEEAQGRIEAGGGPEAQSVARRVQALASGWRFELALAEKGSREVRLRVPGAHNVQNAAVAAAMAGNLGASMNEVVGGLERFELSEMRLQMHTTSGGVTLINDAYNADPSSARAALEVLRNFSAGQRSVAILGDMLDLGARAEEAHRELGRTVARHQIDTLYLLGELAKFIGEGAVEAGMDPERIHQAAGLEALNRVLEERLMAGDVVLFKASRTIGLDRAARHLLESVAPTRLAIDLGAIRDNYHALSRHLGDEVGVMAVVKSFGYGNDATRVSQLLARQGVRALAVAYPDEAIPLRRRGIRLPILVTNVQAAEADKIVKYDLTALIYALPVARALQMQARRAGREVDVHLEVDSGMRRVGLLPEDAVAFGKKVAGMGGLRIGGVMTHLAAADDPAEDAFTHRQLDAFDGVLAGLRAAGVPTGVVHAANTAAAWRHERARYSMVRVGLGLYGLHPSEAVGDVASGVRPALRFTTRILHLQQVEAGDTVGYGRTWRCEGQARRLATIAVGYNDGFPRFLSNGGEVMVGGTRCPVVGNVCMDVAMIDVTDAGPVQVGDEVLLFGEATPGGPAIAVEEWAERGHTISYELLCRISPRVRRIFLTE